MGTLFRQTPNNGYPFPPKWPLKMGMGLEASASHPRPNNIWVPPPPPPPPPPGQLSAPMSGRCRCRLSVPMVGRPEAVVDCRYRRLVIGADSCHLSVEAVVDCRYRRLVIGADRVVTFQSRPLSIDGTNERLVGPRPLSTVGTDGWSSVPTVLSRGRCRLSVPTIGHRCRQLPVTHWPEALGHGHTPCTQI